RVVDRRPPRPPGSAEQVLFPNERSYTPGMSRRDAGITLVEVAAAVTLLGIVVALVVPCIARSSRFQKVQACEANLRTLYSVQAKDYKPDMKERGQEYWTRLAIQTPP